MSEYIRLRHDMSVSDERALEMFNTPVTYTCWNVKPDGTACNHQWNSDLLSAEMGQNKTKCPECGSYHLSFKTRRPDDFIGFQLLDFGGLLAFLAGKMERITVSR